MLSISSELTVTSLGSSVSGAGAAGSGGGSVSATGGGDGNRFGGSFEGGCGTGDRMMTLFSTGTRGGGDASRVLGPGIPGTKGMAFPACKIVPTPPL